MNIRPVTQEQVEPDQYALILNGRLLRFTEADNILDAGEYFMKTGWDEGAVVTNLTELLRGL